MTTPGRNVPARWARFTARRGRWIALGAVLFAAAALLLGSRVAGHLSHGGWTPTGAPSVMAEQRLADTFGTGSEHLVLVVRADGHTAERRVAAHGSALVRALRRDHRVAHVASPWAPDGRRLRATDGAAYAILVRFHGSDSQVHAAGADVLRRTTGRHGPLTVTAAGESAVVAETERLSDRDLRTAELIAAPVTFAVLLLAFRSLPAALLPVAVGALSVAGTMAGLRLLTSLLPVSLLALNITTALGFGLAVDYSLLIVARYREQRATGRSPGQALATTVDTAGRTVAVSALTVCLALAALLFFPLPLLRSLALASIMVTVLAAATTLILIPAALAALGDHLDRWDPLRAVRRRRAGPATTAHLWRRLAHYVLRRPLTTALPVLLALAALAAPLLGARFGIHDDRMLPPTSATARASALLRHHFDVAELRPAALLLPGYQVRTRPGPVADYARRASALPGVRRVDAATGSYRHGRPVPPPPHIRPAAFATAHSTRLSVVADGDPLSPDGARLAERLRALPAPAPVQVAGLNARMADTTEAIVSRLPTVLATITATVFLVLLLLTRSLLLPLKALLLNALTLAATLGTVVHLFQEGHAPWLTGDIAVTHITDLTVLCLIFSIAFGLSMDYEIFLMARIVEEHRRTGDTRTATAVGIEHTARVFTAAALIVAVVMGALAASGLLALKMIGTGLAVAVLLDATLVRAVLVPAFIRLAGRANWWLPRVTARHVRCRSAGRP
ncbi:transporter [Streptomyces sp. WAC 06783]|uniref:MMPL family transporter n=1 Tax=Streptomyces sp. WAC 06783 TaxID=2203211 RepID=UPI000F74B858|nr:MMPL family transporter [Streptomyces sp. WAC 06783]RSO09735.1 transporter [Streptomyces sp. WAC 06783]